MSYLAIIGTSGRNETLNPTHYEHMWDKAKEYIQSTFPNQTNLHVISGGSSWADHIAVRLYNEGVVDKLILYIPSTFRTEEELFNDNYDGKRLNQLHKLFSDECKINSLGEIASAIKKGAHVVKGNNFHHRNTMIANKSTHLIAFTFGLNSPKKGGTNDTWTKTMHANKIHYSLLDL